MTDVVRLGFIGCGTHSTNNLYPALKYARCRLAAVCDRDEALARRNADVFGGRAVYTDADAMLDGEDLDGVLIVGPPAMHWELGKRVLARGIPLFVEKPPAPDLAGAEELVAAARANGTFVMTGFMKRHGLTYRKARELIESGRFTPAAGWFRYGHWANTDLPRMLHTMCIHPVDLAISFFGDPTTVHSTLYTSPRGALSLAVTLRFASGCWVQLTLDSSQPRVQERVEISGVMDGDNALIVVDNVQHMELHTQGGRGTDLRRDLFEIDPDFDLADIRIWRPDFSIPNMAQSRLFFQGFAMEVREFVDAILEGREPCPGTEDTLKAMRVLDVIARNPDSGREIPVPGA